MDLGLYRRYLEEFAIEAIKNSNGTNAGISEYLWSKKMAGRFSQHREEKNTALTELRKSFDDHRHWPLSIIISFLGIENKDLLTGDKI
jgi:hypothetical protein